MSEALLKETRQCRKTCECTGKFSLAGRQKLRIKIKSLAEEAKIIRKEEGKLKGRIWDAGRTSLQQHRIGPLREESRATQIAYGFLKGKPYRAVERDAKTPIPHQRILQLIMKYGKFNGISRPMTASTEFREWLGDTPAGRSCQFN